MGESIDIDDTGSGGGPAANTDSVNRGQSTGWLTAPPVLSINADNTKFDMTGPSTLLLIDTTVFPATVVEVNVPAVTAEAVTNIGTQPATFITIGSAGTPIQLAVPQTEELLRTTAAVGGLNHFNFTTIAETFERPQRIDNIMSLLNDLIVSFGFRVTKGNEIDGIAATLTMSKAAGVGFEKNGGPSQAPGRVILDAESPILFNQAKQDGVTFAQSATLDPTQWDNNGTLDTIPQDNDAAIHRLYQFSDNTVVFMQAQEFFTNFNNAKEAVGLESFVEPPLLESAVFLGRLVMRKDTSDTTDDSEALFIPSSAISSKGETIVTLTKAYTNSTPDAEFALNSTNGAVTHQMYVGGNATNAIEVKDDSTAITFSVKGNGDIATSGTVDGRDVAADGSLLDTIATSYSRRLKVINIVDNTVAPPTEVTDDRYILDFTGSSNAGWDGASAGDIVQFNGTTWDATTPIEGYISYLDAQNKDALYIDDGTPTWEVRSAGGSNIVASGSIANKSTLVLNHAQGNSTPAILSTIIENGLSTDAPTTSKDYRVEHIYTKQHDTALGSYGANREIRMCCIELSNGNVVHVYATAANTYFKILQQSDWTAAVAETEIGSGISAEHLVARRMGDEWVLGYTVGGVVNIIVYNNSGVIQHGPTAPSTDNTNCLHLDLAVYPDNSGFIVLREATADDTYYGVYDTGISLQSEAEIATAGNAGCAVTILSGDKVVFGYSAGGTWTMETYDCSVKTSLGTALIQESFEIGQAQEAGQMMLPIDGDRFYLHSFYSGGATKINTYDISDDTAFRKLSEFVPAENENDELALCYEANDLGHVLTFTELPSSNRVGIVMMDLDGFAFAHLTRGTGYGQFMPAGSDEGNFGGRGCACGLTGGGFFIAIRDENDSTKPYFMVYRAKHVNVAVTDSNNVTTTNYMGATKTIKTAYLG